MADFSITGEVRLNSDPAEKSTSKWTVAAGQMIADFAKQASSKLAEVVKSGVDYNATMESYLTNFKVMLGILEPHETVILSTHLIEEVTGFIGRAVLLHKGQIAGDVQTTELDEQGKTLMDYVKETYSYQSDRVSRALTELTGKEDEHA